LQESEIALTTPRNAFFAASAAREVKKFAPQAPFHPHDKAFRGVRDILLLSARDDSPCSACAGFREKNADAKQTQGLRERQ
jgi:hypothetical protein